VEETAEDTGAELDLPPAPAPARAAVCAAVRKALAVAALRRDALVLGADTVVALGDRLLGKPASADDARRMLRDLAGRTHEVYTGLAFAAWIGDAARVLGFDVVTSAVTFKALPQEEIEAYVRSGEPMDKAGAYGIQGAGGAFVERLRGPWDNVVGLPVARALALLAEAQRTLARLDGGVRG